MRYVFVSDIHGCYDKLIAALNKVNFNSDADTIVSVGDPFDRGSQSKEVLEFLMSCPNRILIWGNHDLRLRDLILGVAKVSKYDYPNGVLNTMHSFCDNVFNFEFINELITFFKSDDRFANTYKLLWKYFDECVFAAEWNSLIATHGWLPNEKGFSKNEVGLKLSAILMPNWRYAAAKSDWIDATWGNTENMIVDKAFPDKTLLVGHWHAWRLRDFEQSIHRSTLKLQDIDFSTYFYQDKLIAIDGCCNVVPGIVNAYVYECDDAPKFY